MEGFLTDQNVEDLSYSELDTFPEFLQQRADEIFSLQLDHNLICTLPRDIANFINLIHLDLSHNQLTYLSPTIVQLTSLRSLNIRCNRLDSESIPKDFGLLQSLEMLNVGGNALDEFPLQFAELVNLKYLYLGANRIKELPKEIEHLQK